MKAARNPRKFYLCLLTQYIFYYKTLPTGGFHDVFNVESTEIYNVDTDTVTLGPNFPSPAQGHCGVIRKRTMEAYFVGGRIRENNEWVFSGITRVFDMVQMTFSILPGQMSVGRLYHKCVLMEEKGLLIAAGGQTDGFSYTDSVEILKLEEETWSSATPLPSVIQNVLATGEVMFNWGTKLYQYEIASNQWLEIEDVPFDLIQMRPNFVQVDAGLGSFCPYISI